MSVKLCIFCFLFVLPSLVANECEDPCAWNGACNDGHDYSCMDSIAGPFKCRDPSVCSGYNDCDDHAAALRSGQICNGFPWFNGGYPFYKNK